MAKRRYLLYCDESASKGKKYANFFGGVLLSQPDQQAISNLLADKKVELGLVREVKWTNITSQNYEQYIEYMRYYFEFIATGRLKARIMFTSRRKEAVGLTDYHRNNRYFLLYYEFIKHAFGLQYCNPNSIDTVYIDVLLDELPDKTTKRDQFKGRISGIENTPAFYGRNIFFPRRTLGEIDSSNHPIHQGIDVILGSMQFKLNEFNLAKPKGQKNRWPAPMH